MDNAARARQRVLALFLPIAAALYRPASPTLPPPVVVTTPAPAHPQS